MGTLSIINAVVFDGVSDGLAEGPVHVADGRIVSVGGAPALRTTLTASNVPDGFVHVSTDLSARGDGKRTTLEGGGHVLESKRPIAE